MRGGEATPPDRPFRREAWQTRVGRRILLLFVVSALLPVTVLAVAAYRTVGASLDRAAREQAQLSAKRLGLRIADRLEGAERELRALDPAAGGAAATASPPVARLSAALVATSDAPPRPLHGQAFDLPPLTAPQAAHVERGGTAVVVRREAGATEVLLVRAGPSPDVRIWGRLDAGAIDSVVAVEVTDADETDVCVLNLSDGAPVTCSAAPVAALLGPALADTVFASFDWSSEGRRYLAGLWSLFLDYRYAAPDWRIVYSRPAAAALAPLARFRQTFSLTALLAVLTVALLSAVQIRRSLDPLRALHEGTERVGRREFDKPVELRSGDEFEDLARGFNGMTRSLEQQFAEGERLRGTLEDLSGELRAREAQLRGVLESAADGIVVIGEAGQIRSFNRAAERLFGWSRDQASQRVFGDLVAASLGEDPAGWLPRDGLGSPSMEVVARRRDGSTFAAELTLGKVDSAGEALYTVFVRDIGDRKRAAEERERLEAQLRQAQKMETIGTLAGGIAHDFNNILTPIVGHVELALAAVGDGELRADLEPIRDAARRARDLVKRILTFSRAGDQAFQPLDVGAVLREVVALLRSSIPATIPVRVHVAGAVPAVVGDSTQLHQVLMNLGTNAYHAMQAAGGTLELRLDTAPVDAALSAMHPRLPDHGAVRLTVRDTGHGMDRATLERLFEPFFTTKPPGVGTGLGMSIVHRIVTSHGGAITVRSEPGVGTEFAIYLPPAESATAVPKGASGFSVTSGHGHVLVVDDDVVVGRLVARVLERVGYEVTRTAAPAEALEIVLAGPKPVDLLITDQTMPGMTGVELARRIRAEHPDFPIILMTGYSEMGTQGPLERLGISELLVKPVEIEPLAVTVARVLQARRVVRAEGPAPAGSGDHG